MSGWVRPAGEPGVPPGTAAILGAASVSPLSASDTDAGIEAVVFDLDGVLIDSHSAVVCATNQALVDNGFLSRAPEELLRFIGPPVFEAFEQLTGEPRDSPVLTTVVESYHEHYDDVYLDETVLFDGIASVLSTLSRSHRLAIATSKPDVFVEPLLVALAVRQFFQVIAAPSLSARDEDKAGTLARALNALGTRRAAMVGDRAFDIEAAHVHGLPAIGVAWGVGSIEELRSAGAEAIASEPADLITILTDGGR